MSNGIDQPYTGPLSFDVTPVAPLLIILISRPAFCGACAASSRE
jgi:hypothetical protein